MMEIPGAQTAAGMGQMRILHCVLCGTVLLGTSNARTVCSVSKRLQCVTERNIEVVMTHRMKFLLSVPIGTVVLDTENAMMEYSVSKKAWFVMGIQEGKTVMMDQTRILHCVLVGAVLMGIGNARMECSV